MRVLRSTGTTKMVKMRGSLRDIGIAHRGYNSILPGR